MLRIGSENSGFTLLELMLSIIIISLLSGLTIPLISRSQTTNDLEVAVQTFVRATRNSQMLSKVSSDDSAWGVHIMTGRVVQYKGANFAGRDPNYDRITYISDKLEASGNDDINFAKISGNPSGTGNTTFTSPNGESKTININSKGTVSY